MEQKRKQHDAHIYQKQNNNQCHARLEQTPAIITCNGEVADVLAQAVERKLFNLGRTAVVITSKMAESDDEKLVIAKALKEAGLIAITALNATSSLSDLALSAEKDADIPEQVKSLN